MRLVIILRNVLYVHVAGRFRQKIFFIRLCGTPYSRWFILVYPPPSPAIKSTMFLLNVGGCRGVVIGTRFVKSLPHIPLEVV